MLLTTLIMVLRGEEIKKNSTESVGRSARFDFNENTINRLPYSPNYEERFYESSGPYPEFSDRRDGYEKDNLPPFPTGFDQFVPDKSSGYGAGNFYLPYTPNIRPDYSIEETNDKTGNKLTTTPPKSKLQDLVLKAMDFLTGPSSSESTEIIEKPSLVSTIKEFFKDPLVSLAAIVIPVSFLLANVIPFFARMFAKMSLFPAITSTLANTVARSLENPAAEQILDAINEFSSRSLEDPRCFQRFLCQTAKAHIENRSADSWSAQRIIQKLAKAVDDKLWDAMGLKMFFSSLQSGHCDILQCKASTALSTNMQLIDKFRVILENLLSPTEVSSST